MDEVYENVKDGVETADNLAKIAGKDVKALSYIGNAFTIVDLGKDALIDRDWSKFAMDGVIAGVNDYGGVELCDYFGDIDPPVSGHIDPPCGGIISEHTDPLVSEQADPPVIRIGI